MTEMPENNSQVGTAFLEVRFRYDNLIAHNGLSMKLARLPAPAGHSEGQICRNVTSYLAHTAAGKEASLRVV